MKYKDILNFLAPCGLNCKKCFAYIEGEIKKSSQNLQKLLGDFDIYAVKFSKFLPIFKNYSNFKEILNYFTMGECPGCREGSCLFPSCGVFSCCKEKSVDYCFQCPEFPCDKTNFDSDLKKRWLQMNKRMKEIGIKEYFEKTKDIPRY